jgi:hypothetical protein
MTQDVLDVALLVAEAIDSVGGEYFVGGSVASSLQGRRTGRAFGTRRRQTHDGRRILRCGRSTPSTTSSPVFSTTTPFRVTSFSPSWCDRRSVSRASRTSCHGFASAFS